MADAAAPPNLMGYLFARDVMKQSLRLGLAGVWNHDHPELMESLELLDTQCPALVHSFLPISEQMDEDGDDEGSHNVVGDDEHRSAQLSIKGFEMGPFFYMKPSTNLMKLDLQHMFVQHLMAAYRTEYSMHVLDLGQRAVKWYQRIAYIDP